MARDYAMVHTKIWDDPDFRDLSADAQLLYIQLLSHKTVSYAGVVDWRPVRLSVLSQGRTVETIHSAAAELVERLFLVIDEDTEEAFIRSFFKWDGLLAKPNMARAMVRAWERVDSLDLRPVIVHELQRLHGLDPDLKGFSVDGVRELLRMDSVNPSEFAANHPLKGSGKGLPKGSGVVPERDAPLPTPSQPGTLLPSPANPSTLLHTPAPNIDAMFEQAYDAWPKKVERKKSLEKFKQACKRRDPHELLADIQRFAAAYKAATTKQFVPALNVWLNGERWTDELPEPGGNHMSVDDRQRQRQQESLNVVDYFRQMEQHEQKELRA